MKSREHQTMGEAGKTGGRGEVHGYSAWAASRSYKIHLKSRMTNRTGISLSVPSSNVRRKKCRLGCIRFSSPSRAVGGLEIDQGDLSQRARGPTTLSHRFKLNMADPN